MDLSQKLQVAEEMLDTAINMDNLPYIELLESVVNDIKRQIEENR